MVTDRITNDDGVAARLPTAAGNSTVDREKYFGFGMYGIYGPMIFTGYFDESDTHRPSPNMVMAGFVGTPYQWERFDKRLAKLQRRHGFSNFHSTEFKARKGEFAGWSDDQKVALIDDLVALVRDKLTLGLACTLPYNRFMQEYQAPPIPKKMKLDSQYGACFRGCLAHLVDFIQGRGRDSKINVVLEHGHKNVGDCIRIFDDLKKRFQRVGGDILGTIKIEEKESCKPLMVADMLAHTRAMVNARSADGTLPAGSLQPFTGSRGGLHFLEFAPDSLRDLKEGYEKLRQLEADAWMERKRQKAAG
jgi:hypothetical protein